MLIFTCIEIDVVEPTPLKLWTRRQI